MRPAQRIYIAGDMGINRRPGRARREYTENGGWLQDRKKTVSRT